MAFYIKIEKMEENSDTATYRFTAHRNTTGEFSINKKTGNFNLIKEMPDDINQMIYQRASIKILRAWREGELPDVTEWAS